MDAPSHMMTRDFRTPRIGAVNYLNSKPLIEGLTEIAPEVELVLDYPSCLADRLQGGELEVALVPSISFLQNPDYEVVSDACVATRGPVLSVKLFCRVPVAEIQSVALDQGSRTSAILTRILLAERYGVFPELSPLPLDWSVEQAAADAILMIGDRAIPPQAETFVETWDLGEEWYGWTGLPFVFAMWVTRAGVELGSVAETLGRARDLGVASLPAIARREAPLLNLSYQTTLDYLTKNLYYQLGERERRGLTLFYQLAAKQGLAPEGNDIVFRNCAAT